MSDYRELVADKALISAVKTDLRVLIVHQDLLKLFQDIILRFRVSFGEKDAALKCHFQIHTGRACEGPIGSESPKSDAIYVSKKRFADWIKN